MKKSNKFRVIKHTKYVKCDIDMEYYTIEKQKSSFIFDKKLVRAIPASCSTSIHSKEVYN